MRIDNFIKTPLPYLTDGGLETFMIFEKGFDLPCFSSHALLETENGRKALTEYLKDFLEIAKKSNRGYVLGTETWRLNGGWKDELGLSDAELLEKNAEAVRFAIQIRSANETEAFPIVINGLIGPIGDGYVADHILSVEDSMALHVPQIHTLAKSGVDMVSALTLTHTSEAIGIVNAAREVEMPIVISFTLETNGLLPSGQSLRDAINEVDAATNAYPIFYMINCAHPDHFRDILENDTILGKRVQGIRANASRLSHAELDMAEELDDGNPDELGKLCSQLSASLPNLRLMGGCCGTDHRHVGCIATHG